MEQAVRRAVGRPWFVTLRQGMSAATSRVCGPPVIPLCSGCDLLSFSSMPHATLDTIARARWRVALTLSMAMVLLYFGFIALIAFARPVLARRVAPGLSLGILLGVLVIIISWLLTWSYMRWTARHYDPALRALKDSTPS